ncbi:MAG: hypothetical protein ACJ8EF_07590 [Bradyrhizobium sp.]
MTSASPIIPSERIVTIDILRGIALFIVLVINAATEFRVSIFEQLLPGTPAATTADKLADGFVLALSTKGFILFSFLFGLGLAIQFDRFAGKSNRLALMLRRLTVLLAIGLVHLLLIWNGDILTEYAMVGFAVLPFLYGPRWLLGITAAVSMAFFWQPRCFRRSCLFLTAPGSVSTLSRREAYMAAAASCRSWH